MKEKHYNFSLECTGHIVTIYSESFRPEPKTKPKQHLGNVRNRLTPQHWRAYLRAHSKTEKPDPTDPQGMVPFGKFNW